jgi:hypothetical protein
MVIPCDVPIRTGNRFIMTWQEDKAESVFTGIPRVAAAKSVVGGCLALCRRT